MSVFIPWLTSNFVYWLLAIEEKDLIHMYCLQYAFFSHSKSNQSYLGIWYAISKTEKLNFTFYSILMNLNC